MGPGVLTITAITELPPTTHKVTLDADNVDYGLDIKRPQGRHDPDHSARLRRVERVHDRDQGRARGHGGHPGPDVRVGPALDLRGLSLQEDLRHAARAGHPARAGRPSVP